MGEAIAENDDEDDDDWWYNLYVIENKEMTKVYGFLKIYFKVEYACRQKPSNELHIWDLVCR